MKKLTERQKDFCRFYVECRNPEEAADLAGVKKPRKNGPRLLADGRIKEEIERLGARRVLDDEVAQGLRRIAFGRISDAVGLLLDPEGAAPRLPELDLFCVSEIKMQKNGTVEFKFFDRLKALQLMSELSGGDEDAFSPFAEAVKLGAERLAGGREE